MTTFIREHTLIIGVLKSFLTVQNWFLNHKRIIIQTTYRTAFESTSRCHVAIIDFIFKWRL